MRPGWLMLAAMLCLIGATAPARGWSREWLCFFREQDVALTDRCKLILAGAAQDWHDLREGRARSHPPMGTTLRPAIAATILAVGHAGDGGGPDGNQHLAHRRALAVIAELHRLGIPGEYLIPLSLGGREPWGDAAQDRRVRLEWSEPSVQP